MDGNSHPSGSFIKRLRKSGCVFIEDILAPQLFRKINRTLIDYPEIRQELQLKVETLFRDLPDKATRSIYIYYPSIFDTCWNKGVLRINCSFLSATLESQWTPQQDLLSKCNSGQLSMERSSGILVKSVTLQHQFLEKLLMMHEVFRYKGITTKYLEGGSRHLYDIVSINDRLEAMEIPLNRKLYGDLRYYRNQWFGRSCLMHRSTSLNQLCFVPPVHLLGFLMDDYRALRKQLIFDTRLDFPSLIGKLQKVNEKINGRLWQPTNYKKR